MYLPWLCDLYIIISQLFVLKFGCVSSSYVLLMLVYSTVGRHLVYLVFTILPCKVVPAVWKRFVSGSGICARYKVAVGVWVDVLSVWFTLCCTIVPHTSCLIRWVSPGIGGIQCSTIYGCGLAWLGLACLPVAWLGFKF